MSCDNSNVYNQSCCPDTPYPSTNHESVPSLIDNLVDALYGEINKTVQGGRVVWDIPCDPASNPAEVPSIPRQEGEGLLCYIMRCFIAFATEGFNLNAPFLRWSFTGDGTTTTYNLPQATGLLPNSYLVYIDGVVQDPINYTLSNNTPNPISINFSTAVPNASVVTIISLGGATPSTDASFYTVTPTGSSTSDTLADWIALLLQNTSSFTQTTNFLSLQAATARNLVTRFADSVNVKDFGAVGDGIADDWLPIQRAIYAACYASNFDFAGAGLPLPSAITINDTFTLNGIPNVPRIFVGQGYRRVVLPPGNYRISRPLVVQHGTSLYGLAGGPDKVRLQLPSGSNYNAIETFLLYIIREFWNQNGGNNRTPLEALGVNSYNAGLQIQNITVEYKADYPVSRVGTVATATIPNHNYLNGDSIYVSGAEPFGYGPRIVTGTSTNTISFAVANSGATSANVDIVNTTRPYEYDRAWYPGYIPSWPTVSAPANSGQNLVTINRWVTVHIGAKIRFSGGTDVYEVASYTTTSNSTTFTLTTNLTRNINIGEIYLIGLPSQNGILICGGENILIKNIYANFFRGAGIYAWNGSPGPVIDNCMSNHNVVAYWSDASSMTLIKPSGDANNVFFRAGYFGGSYSNEIYNLKHEDFGGFPSDEMFDIATEASGGAPCLTVSGGSCNAGNLTYSQDTKIRELVKIQSWNTTPIVNFKGFFAGSYGNYVYRMYNRYTGALIRQRARFAPTDSDGSSVFGTSTLLDAFNWEPFVDQDFNARLQTTADGNGKLNGGLLAGQQEWAYAAPFSRSGTVLTVNVNNHGLQVGDFVLLINYQNISPWFTYTTNGAGNPAFYQGTAFVQTVSTNSFTITVQNSGPVSGNCHVEMMKFFNFHAIRNGTHRIQMPNTTTIGVDSLCFQLLNKRRDRMAGLVIEGATPDNGHWWAKDELRTGGLPDNPLTRIRTSTVTLSGLSGATATASSFIPAGSIVFGVTARVSTAITGATSFDIGDGTDVDRWGAAVAIALNTTTSASNFTITSLPIYSSATNVVLTANGSNFTAGEVKLVLHYVSLNPPA